MSFEVAKCFETIQMLCFILLAIIGWMLNIVGANPHFSNKTT